MQGLFDFIIKPKAERTTSVKKIGSEELILNTEMQNHEYVSRHGIVLNTPLYSNVTISNGTEVILHHNVFRRFYDIRGVEKNSRSYYEDNKYLVRPDQIFLYKKNNDWIATEGFCFVKPLKNKEKLSTDNEVPFKGIIRYSDELNDKNGFLKNDLVGFTPGSEYEFVIDNERLYRVPTNKITIKYEYQGDEEEYNPSWT